MKNSKRNAGSRKIVRTAPSARELVRQMLRQELHTAMRGLVHDMFEQEVTALCGPRYVRNRDAEGSRAGGEQGAIYWDGRREPAPRAPGRHGPGQGRWAAGAAEQPAEADKRERRPVHRLVGEEGHGPVGPGDTRNREAEETRAGSGQGSISWDGRREPLRRPRVRDGQGEVRLESYDALRDYDLFRDEVQRLLIRGVSTRDFSELTEKLDEDLPLSKSSASRAFQRASQRDLDEINGRDLSGETYCCIMINGIEKAGSHVMVAMGLTTKGHKTTRG